MKKQIVVILLLLIGQNFANAYTCENQIVKCPIYGGYFNI